MSDGSPSSLHSPTGETVIELAERPAVRWRRAAAPRFRARTQERAHRSSLSGANPKTFAHGRALQEDFACWRGRSTAGPPSADIPGGHICRHALKRTQRPFFGDVGLSCTDCQKQALRRGSVGTDSLLELPGRPEPPCRSGVFEHRTQRSLLAPLADRSPSHSHPPTDERPHHRPRPFSGHAIICLAGLTFGAHPSQCDAPRRSVRIILLHAKSCRPCSAKRATCVEE